MEERIDAAPAPDPVAESRGRMRGVLGGRRNRIIAGGVAAALVAGGGIAAGLLVSDAQLRRAYAETADRIDEHRQAILDAEARAPQAAYLYVAEWRGPAQEERTRLRAIAGAPDTLIPAALIGPVRKAAEAFEERLVEDAPDAPGQAQIAQFERVADDLEKDWASFAPRRAERVERAEDVTRAVLRAARAEERRLASAASSEREAVDRAEAGMDALDAAAVAHAELLAGPAEAALKNREAYVEPFAKASEDVKRELLAQGEELRRALDVYAGRKQAPDPDPDQDPGAADRLDFSHTVEAGEPGPEVSRALTGALAEYVTAARAVLKAHDAAVAAEQAAAEQAAAGGAVAGGEADAGAAAPTGAESPGGGGWTGRDTGGAGGGSAPPVPGGGGGAGAPATPPPAGGGGADGVSAGGGGAAVVAPPAPGWSGCGGGQQVIGHDGAGNPLCGTPGW